MFAPIVFAHGTQARTVPNRCHCGDESPPLAMAIFVLEPFVEAVHAG